MGKKEFLAALRRALRGLPARDIDGHCEFFEEIINDRMEDGLSEAAAVRSLGGVSRVAEQIISQTPLSRIVKEKLRSGGIGFWGVLLIIFASPVWISLAAAAFAVLVSLWAAAFAVAVSLWAAELGIAVGAVGGLGFGAFLLFGSSRTGGLFMISEALVAGGIAIFMFFVCKAITKVSMLFVSKSLLGIKNLFLRRGI